MHNQEEFSKLWGIYPDLRINKELPAPQNDRGYKPASFIYPLFLILNGGGQTLEGLRKICTDEELRDLSI